MDRLSLSAFHPGDLIFTLSSLKNPFLIFLLRFSNTLQQKGNRKLSFGLAMSSSLVLFSVGVPRAERGISEQASWFCRESGLLLIPHGVLRDRHPAFSSGQLSGHWWNLMQTNQLGLFSKLTLMVRVGVTTSSMSFPILYCQIFFNHGKLVFVCSMASCVWLSHNVVWETKRQKYP